MPRSISPVQSPPPSGPPIDASELTGRVVFSDGDDVWSSLADGTSRRRLTSDPGLDFDPSWSPDGRQIVFRTHRTGNEEIFVMNADGSDAHDVSNSPGGDWSPAWSPDGKIIAYSSDRGGIQAVWLMAPDGSDKRVLTTIEGEYPSWSPDSRSLAFASGQGGLYDVMTVALGGTAPTNLTHSPAAYDFAPSWSPDGRFIAYDTQGDYRAAEPGIGPEFEIHVIDVATGIDRRVTFNFVEDRFPCWSPDGRFLLWSRGGELVVARPDGSGARTIGSGSFPDWIASR